MARANVDALERLVEQEQPAGFCLPATEHDLLLVAAGERPDGGGRARGADAEPPDGGFGLLPLAARPDEAGGIPAGKMRQADRLGDGLAGPAGRHQRGAVPVLARHGDAGSDRLGRRLRRIGRAVEAHRAAGEPAGAEQCGQQPALARAEHAGDRHHLAAMEREAERLAGRQEPRVRDLEHRSAFRLPGVRPRGGEGPADHGLDRLVEIDGPRERLDHAPAAQHGDVVGERRKVGGAVGDVEDRDAAPLEIEQRGVEPPGFAGGKARRRLVEDEQFGPVGQRAGDGDELPVGGRKLGEVPVDRQVEARLAQHGLCLPAHPAARDEEGLAAVDEAVEQQRIAHRQARDADEVGRLVHGHDAGGARLGRRLRGIGAPLEGDAAAVGRKDAGEDLHEGRLARAVRAHQRHDLAGIDGKRQVDEGFRRSEGSGEGVGFKQGHGVGRVGLQDLSLRGGACAQADFVRKIADERKTVPMAYVNFSRCPALARRAARQTSNVSSKDSGKLWRATRSSMTSMAS